MPLPALGQQFGPESAVIDQAGVIDSATRNAIDRCLLELERKTTAQVRVLTVDSTHGRDIHDFAIEIAQKQREHIGQRNTGLGQAGKDNGVLMVVAVKDRRYRFEVGEGLEGTLPDLYCDSIAQKCFVPNFRKGNYAAGIYSAVAAVAQKIAADAGVQLEGLPSVPADSRERQHGAPVGTDSSASGVCCCGPLVLFLVFAILFGVLFSPRQRGYRTWGYGYGGGGFWQGMLPGNLMGHMTGGSRGWSGGSSWGGGFGGGGSFGGGFGGGGGGSFGGGGCSGSW